MSNSFALPIKPRKALNKAFLKVKPYREDIEVFKKNLIKILDFADDSESEEYHKNLVSGFLKDSLYHNKYFINTSGRSDQVIHVGPKPDSAVGVIIEAKNANNKSEMVSYDNLNKKAFHELLLYFLRERITKGNLEVKNLIITNLFEWFIFDANSFEKSFVANKSFVKKFKDFEAGNLSGTNTDFFYNEIAKPFLADFEGSFSFVHFDLRKYEKIVRNDDSKDDQKLVSLFKVLSPEHLLKLPFENDSNSLDKRFYTELLHIIGLTEVKKGSKKLIQRNEEGQRNLGSLLENTILQLESRDKISRLPNSRLYGENKREQLFNVGLELVITWVNRILFLKLLEAQLIRYHKGNNQYAFLNLKMIKDYDDLDSLFFQVLAKKHEERKQEAKTLFGLVPYLNSSLFEPTDIEHDTLFVSNLRDDKPIPIISSTVLKNENGKKRSGELSTLEYLFVFLDAYDFSSEGAEDIQEDNKTLINASVLGLIFEKINGYKDGSFFTPGFITMYMCKETIRKAVVQKFNEVKNWNCKNLDDVYDKIEDRNEANNIINSLKICDPAVGSGHFLVSALNELIAIKNDLRIFQDIDGKRLKEYEVEVINDELVITDDEGELFEYRPTNKESLRVQMALFHEKQTLIENCLFGVDINPNSVKICRLRLWIELLKNAYYKGENELETLPNIDINIKSGNSLISRFALDDDLKEAFKDKKIAYNFLDYKQAVNDYKKTASKEKKREILNIINEVKNNFRSTLDNKFIAKFQKAQGSLINEQERQNNLRAFDQKITKIDKDKLKKLQKKAEKALLEKEEIVNNVIYENAFEWRFEFPEVLNDKGDYLGFDVIIGNPPYGSIFNKVEKKFIKNHFQFTDYQFDIYMTFFEKSYDLLKTNGLLSFIVPNTWLLNLKTPNIRQLLFNKFKTQKIRAYSFPIFEEAVVDTVIVGAEKTEKINGSMAVEIVDIDNELIENHFSKDELSKNFKSHLNIYLSEFASSIASKFSSLRKLDDVSIITQGTKPFQKGKGKPKQDAKIMEDKPYVQTFKKDDSFRPLLRGSLINRYVINWNENYYICLGDWLAEPRYSAGYDSPQKIVIRQTGSSLVATLDSKQFVVRDNLYTIISVNEDYPESVLLAFLNSRLMNWYYQNVINNEVGEALAQVKRGHLAILPIPKYNDEIFENVISLVNKAIETKEKNNSSDIANLENQIDKWVYQLYELTKDEIKIIENS